MISIDTNQKCYTSIQNMDYFPIIVSANEDINNIRYVEIVKGTDNLIEFTVNKKTGMFCRMKLILCKEYSLKNNELILPEKYSDGTLVFDEISKYQTDTFKLKIFQNGIRIDFRNDCDASFYRNGHLIMGLDSSRNPVSLEVLDLNDEDINHILNELKYSEAG